MSNLNNNVISIYIILTSSTIGYTEEAAAEEDQEQPEKNADKYEYYIARTGKEKQDIPCPRIKT